MENRTPTTAVKLQKGHLWKLKRSYIYIVALMSSTIQFKFMDSQAEMQARTLTSGTDNGRTILPGEGIQSAIDSKQA